MLCLRDIETIKANPALASHAERVNKRTEKFKEAKDLCSWAHVDIFKNRDIKRSSRHNSKDRRWRRLITTPIIPRKNRENRTVVKIFTGRS